MFSAEFTDVALFGSIARYGDMSIHAVLDLRRSFSRAALERAASAAITAFPVFARRYQPRPWRDQWVPVERPVSEMVRLEETEHDDASLERATAEWARTSLDVTVERPLRVVSLPKKGGSRLILTVSHLAVDGAGAAAVGHVMGASLYGKSTVAPTDHARDVHSVLDRVELRHAPVLARDIATLMVHPLRTLSAGRRSHPYPAAAPDRSETPHWRHMLLSVSEVESLKARCASAGASLNDALVAALARVAAGRTEGPAVSVLYTMDLRRYRRSPMLSAANTSAFLPVLVPRAKTESLQSALTEVSKRTRHHKMGMTGPGFALASAALSAGAPHGLLRKILPIFHEPLVALPMSRGFLVTNVGRLDDGLSIFGDDLEAVRIIGPSIRGIDVAAVVAYGFRGELQLQLYAPPGVAEEALPEMERELHAALELTSN